MTKKQKYEQIDVSTFSDIPGGVFIDGAPIPEPEPVRYESVMWSGVLPTFRCTMCGHCDPDKDEIILHVITHAAENDMESLLEKLMKE